MVRKYVNKKEKEKMPAEGYVCFLSLVKEVSYIGPIRFTIVDRNDNHIPVEIIDGNITISCISMSDASALTFISNHAKDFERLFFESAKKYDRNKRLTGRLYIAKIADMSFVTKRKAAMRIYADRKTRDLQISRRGDEPVFTLDGQELSLEQGEQFIWENYNEFLINYKNAVKGMTGTLDEESQRRTHLPRKGIKADIDENGKITVDLDGILGKSRNTKKGTPDTSLADDILKKGRKGFAE